ncbi:MAG: CPBP family intramembrane metalloprotease [Alphaproteobacteria bacterium]|nr:CPBP family intramembrane metalloprotease [Alphaproteobacteria bacterium]
MKRLIAAIPQQAEIAIVLICAFGLPLTYSVLIASGVVDAGTTTDARLVRLLIFELATLGLLGSLLWARGWTLERLGFGTPVLQDAIDGAGLVAVAYLLPACILLVLPTELKQSAASTLLFGPLSLPAIVATSIVNPVFEEVFVVGYVFAALRGANGMLAINVSIALRLAYHLYQGAASVIFILPLAVMFAWWYSKRASLWPLLFAHAALDFMALSRHLG